MSISGMDSESTSSTIASSQQTPLLPIRQLLPVSGQAWGLGRMRRGAMMWMTSCQLGEAVAGEELSGHGPVGGARVPGAVLPRGAREGSSLETMLEGVAEGNGISVTGPR